MPGHAFARKPHQRVDLVEHAQIGFEVGLGTDGGHSELVEHVLCCLHDLAGQIAGIELLMQQSSSILGQREEVGTRLAHARRLEKACHHAIGVRQPDDGQVRVQRSHGDHELVVVVEIRRTVDDNQREAFELLDGRECLLEVIHLRHLVAERLELASMTRHLVARNIDDQHVLLHHHGHGSAA